MALTALLILLMSAHPDIKIGQVRAMHHRCQVWMGTGWITIQAEMGALLCEEKDGQLAVIGSPDEPSQEGNGGGEVPFRLNQPPRAADETDGKPPTVSGGNAQVIHPWEACRSGESLDECIKRPWSSDSRGKSQDIQFTKWSNCNPGESAKECYERAYPPEPADVPAVQVTDGSSYVAPCSPRDPDSYPYCAVPRWKCEDSSRILLTSEDGKHWCHKVEP